MSYNRLTRMTDDRSLQQDADCLMVHGPVSSRTMLERLNATSDNTGVELTNDLV